MLETTRYEAGKRVKGAVVLTAGVGVFGLLVIGFWPSFRDVYGELYEEMPQFLLDVIGGAGGGTLEGFLATEFYWFVWVLLLGLYFAYAAGELIAGDVETGRMDLVLSMPVSRARVVGEKFAWLGVPIVLVNIVVPVVVYAGVLAVGESVPIENLVMLHVLSVPYFLACAGIGLAFSVAFDRAAVAQRVALGVVFGLFLIDSVASAANVAWAGRVSPMRYYDPVAILVLGEYDFVAAGLLLAAATGLVAVSVVWFRRVDIE